MLEARKRDQVFSYFGISRRQKSAMHRDIQQRKKYFSMYYENVRITIEAYNRHQGCCCFLFFYFIGLNISLR